MDTVFLIRNETSDEGTFGSFAINQFRCVSAELPNRNNKVGVSCIPVGDYVCRWLYSNEHKRNIYHITDVPNRTDIEIHSGNWAGDITKGLKSDVKGCCILGNKIEIIEGQKGITDSKDILARFEKLMGGAPFKLIITEM